jgi:hypothetical protein
MYKQKFSALLHAIVNVWGKDDEMFEMVGDALKAFGNYVMSVYEMETRIMLLRFRCDDPAEYQDEVMGLDRNRKAAHDAAIAQCSILNRLAGRVGLDDLGLCPATDDRYVIAEFCADIVKEFFDRGQENHSPISDKEVQDFIEKATE